MDALSASTDPAGSISMQSIHRPTDHLAVDLQQSFIFPEQKTTNSSVWRSFAPVWSHVSGISSYYMQLNVYKCKGPADVTFKEGPALFSNQL